MFLMNSDLFFFCGFSFFSRARSDGAKEIGD